MSKMVKVGLIVVVLGVLLYLAYIKFFKVKAIDPVTGAPIVGNQPLPPVVAEKPGDVNLCAWLNNTYPKMKTGEFNDIDGGAHNPQAKIDWDKNKCSLIF